MTMLRASSNERVYTYVDHESIEHTVHNDTLYILQKPERNEVLGWDNVSSEM